MVLSRVRGPEVAEEGRGVGYVCVVGGGGTERKRTDECRVGSSGRDFDWKTSVVCRILLVENDFRESFPKILVPARTVPVVSVRGRGDGRRIEHSRQSGLVLLFPLPHGSKEIVTRIKREARGLCEGRVHPRRSRLSGDPRHPRTE